MGTRSLTLSAHLCSFHMLLHGRVLSCATARGGPGLIAPTLHQPALLGNSSAGTFSSCADLQPDQGAAGVSVWSARTMLCP